MSLSAYERRVLDLLMAGPLTAPELQRLLELKSDGWLYGVLSGLEHAGVIRATRVRLRGVGGGSGKGAKVYQLVGVGREEAIP